MIDSMKINFFSNFKQTIVPGLVVLNLIFLFFHLSGYCSYLLGFVSGREMLLFFQFIIFI